MYSNDAPGSENRLQPFLEINLAINVKTFVMIIYFGSVISVLWILSKDVILNSHGKEKMGNTLKVPTQELAKAPVELWWSGTAWWSRPCSGIRKTWDSLNCNLEKSTNLSKSQVSHFGELNDSVESEN